MSSKNLGRIDLAYKVLVLPPMILFILLALPLVGNVLVILFTTKVMHCPLSAGSAQACVFLGHDIGGISYAYAMSLVLLGAFNILYAIWIYCTFVPKVILLAWLAFALTIIVLRRKIKKQISDNA